MGTHFVICLVSFVNKCRLLESRERKPWKLFFCLPIICLLTSLIYIVSASALYALTEMDVFLTECTLGLSGPLFALKILYYLARNEDSTSLSYHKIIKSCSHLYEI